MTPLKTTIRPYTADDDPFDPEFNPPYFGWDGVLADGELEHIADRHTYTSAWSWQSCAGNRFPGAALTMPDVHQEEALRSDVPHSRTRQQGNGNRSHKNFRGAQNHRLASSSSPFRQTRFLFLSKSASFVDGCFWHSCPKHSNLPVNNRSWQRNSPATSFATGSWSAPCAPGVGASPPSLAARPRAQKTAPGSSRLHRAL